VWARRSPFETKDVLKARGYRWNDVQKTWFADKSPADADAELQWLREHVYGGAAVLPAEVVTFTAKERYSDRG
jgi:DNA polymerase III subunit epsilon